MQTRSADIAIVTVTYNCEDFIQSFLEAACAQLKRTDCRTVLVIVDNASSDKTIEVARRFIDAHQLGEQVMLLPQDNNLGFGRGCNAGVEASQHLNPEFVWFLNPDTKIFEETGPQLVKFLRENTNADFVGSQLVNADNVARPSAFRFPSVMSEFCRSVRLGILDRLLSGSQIAMPVSAEAHPADWLTGASFMVRSEVFHKLGGFDPEYFLYFEEVDLFFRAKKAGFECWFNPHSKVYHFAGASTGISSARKASKPRPQYWFDSRRYFYCKNFGRVYFALCDFAAIAGLSLWKLRVLLQKKECPDPPGLLRDIAANSVLFSRAER